MTETIQYEQFEQASAGNGSPAPGEADLNRLSDIPMELSVEIGRTHMTVGETLDLRVGSVVALERLAGETADLLVNGTAIARGEVVVIDEQYGLRITEIIDGHAEGGGVADAAAAARAFVGSGAGGEAEQEDSAAMAPPTRAGDDGEEEGGEAGVRSGAGELPAMQAEDGDGSAPIEDAAPVEGSASSPQGEPVVGTGRAADER